MASAAPIAAAQPAPPPRLRAFAKPMPLRQSGRSAFSRSGAEEKYFDALVEFGGIVATHKKTFWLDEARVAEHTARRRKRAAMIFGGVVAAAAAVLGFTQAELLGRTLGRVCGCFCSRKGARREGIVPVPRRCVLPSHPSKTRAAQRVAPSTQAFRGRASLVEGLGLFAALRLCVNKSAAAEPQYRQRGARPEKRPRTLPIRLRSALTKPWNRTRRRSPQSAPPNRNMRAPRRKEQHFAGRRPLIQEERFFSP